jgi:hypothetical protein
MLYPNRFCFRLSICLAGLLVAALSVGPALGQKEKDKPPVKDKDKPAVKVKDKPPVKDEEGRLPREGSEKLLKDYDRAAEGIFRTLYQGKLPYDEKDHAKLVDAAAKFYAYRLTWEELHEKGEDTFKQPGMAKMIGEVDNFLSYSAKQPGAEEFRSVCIRKLAGYLKDVLPNRYLIARVNAALLLARIAEYGGYEEMADILAETIKDPRQIDAVRYWALKGLQKLFETEVLKVGKPTKDPQRLPRTLQAVAEFINRPPPVTKETTPAEIEALKVVRREAVAALAAARVPMLTDKEGKELTDKDDKPLMPRPALVLLKLARRDGLALDEPRIDEQVEAAIGVARMLLLNPTTRPGKEYRDYQPDYAAYELARFVEEFAGRYDARKGTREEFLPWKKYAGTLAEALDQMKADTDKAKHPSSKYVAQVVARCKDLVLTPIEKGDLRVSAESLTSWLDTDGRPQSPMLFKDLPTSTVKPAEKK